MVSRATTTALILLTLVLMAPPVLAHQSNVDGSGQAAEPCNWFYYRPENTIPVDVHAECLPLPPLLP